MMRLSKFFIPLILVLCAASGCKSEYEVLLEGNDVDAKYAAAFDYFNQESICAPPSCSSRCRR